MADKKWRRPKRKELLQMLLAQCEETERKQEELDQATACLEALEESYERLKVTLNIKDERLAQKDARITELQCIIEETGNSKEIDLQKAGSIADAAQRLNEIFEAAQEAADQYLENVMRLASTGQTAPEDTNVSLASEIPERSETVKKHKSFKVVLVHTRDHRKASGH